MSSLGAETKHVREQPDCELIRKEGLNLKMLKLKQSDKDAGDR